MAETSNNVGPFLPFKEVGWNNGSLLLIQIKDQADIFNLTAYPSDFQIYALRLFVDATEVGLFGKISLDDYIGGTGSITSALYFPGRMLDWYAASPNTAYDPPQEPDQYYPLIPTQETIDANVIVSTCYPAWSTNIGGPSSYNYMNGVQTYFINLKKLSETYPGWTEITGSIYAFGDGYKAQTNAGNGYLVEIDNVEILFGVYSKKTMADFTMAAPTSPGLFPAAPTFPASPNVPGEVSTALEPSKTATQTITMKTIPRSGSGGSPGTTAPTLTEIATFTVPKAGLEPVITLVP